MNIKNALKESIQILKYNEIENPILISKLVLSNLLNVSKEYLLINELEIINEKTEESFISNINKICTGYPVQYITNEKEFMGFNFYVDENVLVPREDTEILVLETIEYIKSNFSAFDKINILELCTGSGVISISILKVLKEYNIDIIATDISDEAIKVSQKNSEKYNLKNIKFIKSDMFEKFEKNINSFDILISNPPYIETRTIECLDDNVKHEPFIALDGGEDGLDFYIEISKKANNVLKDNGAIFLEIGYNQKESVVNILANDGYKNIKCIKDLSRNDRVICCKKG